MMSKAKWFAVRKPSTGEIIATSANQIVPLKFCGPTKMLYYIHQTPVPLAVLKGGLGTRLSCKVFIIEIWQCVGDHDARSVRW